MPGSALASPAMVSDATSSIAISRDSVAPPVPQHRATAVDDDLRQPGVEAVAIPKTRQGAPGAEGAVLDGIARIRLAAQDRDRDPVEPLEPRAEECVEGIGIPVRGALEQQGLVGDGQGSHPDRPDVGPERRHQVEMLGSGIA